MSALPINAADLYPADIQYWQAVAVARPHDCALLSVGIEPRRIAELRELQLAEQISLDDFFSNADSVDFDGSVDLGEQQSLVDGRTTAIAVAVRTGELKSEGAAVDLADFVAWALVKVWSLPEWLVALAPVDERQGKRGQKAEVVEAHGTTVTRKKRAATLERERILTSLAKQVTAERPVYDKVAVAAEVQKRAAKEGVHLSPNRVRNILYALESTGGDE